MVLSAGAVIDPIVLEKEITALEMTGAVDDLRSRLFIHPRAAVIGQEDVEYERLPKSGAAQVASTQHGVGAAISRRVMRVADLAGDTPSLHPYIREVHLNTALAQGGRVVLEIPQGLGLGLYSGYRYPYCTGREVSVAQGMTDAQIDPRRLGDVMMVIRTFPIRVGNIPGVGNSGPFYPDSMELTWEEIGVEAEITTVTKRVRRVATFSYQQYKESLNLLNPNYVFLNFVNYLSASDADSMTERMGFCGMPPTHLGMGPRIDDVVE
jgi:adenylosuccinate synthase